MLVRGKVNKDKAATLSKVAVNLAEKASSKFLGG
jgi:hypothetical protein